MRVVITGEKGFLGIHLTHYLRYILKYEVIELGRDYLENLSKTKDIDWLIHAACVHRHSEPEMVLTLNTEITNRTIACLRDNNIQCNVVLLSSIHDDTDTFYGQSKREAKVQFQNYCLENKRDFISYKLPNIFGRYSMPNRTSFIATFSYNLFNDLPIQYNKNAVQLAFIDDIVEVVCSFKAHEIHAVQTTVEEVYLLLERYKKSWDASKFPDFKNKFESDLYQTFISYRNYRVIN